jgi:hypothetical protein
MTLLFPDLFSLERLGNEVGKDLGKLLVLGSNRGWETFLTSTSRPTNRGRGGWEMTLPPYRGTKLFPYLPLEGDNRA